MNAAKRADRIAARSSKGSEPTKPAPPEKSEKSMLNLLKKRESSRKNKQYSPDKIEKWFSVFDVNDDKTISRSEFVAALTRSANGKNAFALTEDHAQALFDEMDEDGNGSVDMTEFATKWAEFNATYGTGRIVEGKGMLGRRGMTFLRRRSSSKTL